MTENDHATGGIEQSEFFDGRHDEVVSEDEQTAVVQFGHDTFGDYQLEKYHDQDEWALDVMTIWEGNLQANFERNSRDSDTGK